MKSWTLSCISHNQLTIVYPPQSGVLQWDAFLSWPSLAMCGMIWVLLIVLSILIIERKYKWRDYILVTAVATVVQLDFDKFCWGIQTSPNMLTMTLCGLRPCSPPILSSLPPPSPPLPQPPLTWPQRASPNQSVNQQRPHMCIIVSR